MKIDEVHAMWSEDCNIDNKNLDEASRYTPNLHSKYLEIYSQERSRLVMYTMEQKKLLKKKWMYYNGKMSQEDIAAEGWSFDPFDGLKVLKGEMDYYYDADDDIQRSEMKMQLQKQKIEVLKDIIDNIKWRHQTIKNMILWRQFQAGG
jgi:hypothetical protein